MLAGPCVPFNPIHWASIQNPQNTSGVDMACEARTPRGPSLAKTTSFSPKLFLLDEPLSALDAKLREAMQVELRQLQQKLGITAQSVIDAVKSLG